MPAEDPHAPEHTRQQPAWISDLIEFGNNTFRKTVTCKIEQLTSKKEKRFMMQVPLWVMDFEIFSVPGVWPLKGCVERVKAHWFSPGVNPKMEFPPPGMLLELGFFKHPIEPQHAGTFVRTNLDLHFLAYLMMAKDVVDGGDAAAIAAMREASGNITCGFTFYDTCQAKLVAAYQMREDEEKASDVLGHSVLTRARTLCQLQDH